MNSQKINDAVKACVHYCLDRDEPLAALREHFELLARDGWQSQELHEVETLTRRMLLTIGDPRNHS